MMKLERRYASFHEMLENIPRETIATVGDTRVTIPVEVPLSFAMAYNRQRITRGDDLAIAWAMELMLGKGLDDLLESGISDSDWVVITDIVIGRVRGATTGTADETPKALTNGSSSTPKRAAPRGRRAVNKS